MHCCCQYVVVIISLYIPFCDVNIIFWYYTKPRQCQFGKSKSQFSSLWYLKAQQNSPLLIVRLVVLAYLRLTRDLFVVAEISYLTRACTPNDHAS